MAGVQGRLNVHADYKLAGVAHGENPPVHPVLIDFLLSFDAGTGALGKADLLYNEIVTIAASGSTDLDLTGVLKDPLGGNFNNAEIMLALFKADALNVNNVIIGNAAANPFLGPLGALAHTLKLEPGNMHVLTSIQGWPVVAATGDLLHLANSGAGSAVNVEVLLIGRSVVG